MSVKRNFDVNGFRVDFELDNGVCLFNYRSGHGVSYAFRLLQEYCRQHRIPCRLLDELTPPEDARKIIERPDALYLLLDHANCYLDPQWLLNVDYGKCRILIHEHQPLGLFKLPLDKGMYNITFDEDRLEIYPSIR